MKYKIQIYFQNSKIIKSTKEDKLSEKIQARLNSLTKPPGALGTLESIARKIGLIQKTIQPKVDKKIHFVFAADHGICEEGVSAYPSEVTRQMVLNMLGGGAAINVFCNMQQIPCKIFDVGVKGELPDDPRLLSRKVRHGTENFLKEAAMTEEEVLQAMQVGFDAIAVDFPNYDLYSLGEMGIGNTTPSTAIVAATENFSVETICGRGAGLNDQGVERKIKVIREAIKKHRPIHDNPFDILRKVGGLEIAALVGTILAGAVGNKVIVIDGIITGAAFIIAQMIQPAVIDYCFFGHRSSDRLGTRIFDHIIENPLLDLNMRLGEGTGAVLAIPILQAACNMINEMATFQDAKVSGKA